MKPEEIRGRRVRVLMERAPEVKSYNELVNYAIGKFGVTKKTAEGYADTVIEYYKNKQGVE